MELKVTDVIFNKEFYTRSESQSPSKVQEYAKSIAGGEFPPILLNQDNNLLDGWHRWMAHKECKLETILAEFLDTTGMDVFTIRRKAARSNFRHGQPQTESELKKLIRDEYRGKLDNLDQKGRSDLKQEMATDYSRSIAYVREVTSRIDKDLKVELRETAFNMWMACYSVQEIADTVGYSKSAVGEFTNLLQSSENATGGENGQSSKKPPLAKTAGVREFDEEPEEDSNSLGVYVLDKRLLIKADHMDEHFKPPIYNVWKQQTRSTSAGAVGK